jgi:hypothetical protein
MALRSQLTTWTLPSCALHPMSRSWRTQRVTGFASWHGRVTALRRASRRCSGISRRPATGVSSRSTATADTFRRPCLGARPKHSRCCWTDARRRLLPRRCDGVLSGALHRRWARNDECVRKIQPNATLRHGPLAVAVKFLPIVLTPLYWRRVRVRDGLMAMVVAGILYVPRTAGLRARHE